MNNSKVSKVTRIFLFICSIWILAVLFTPIWLIELSAPQYPEGLTLLIYAKGLSGNVDIINGLNHYIGMKALHSDDFIEFKILPVIILLFSLSLIIIAVAGRRKWMNIFCIIFVLFGIISMIDFWRWEHNYGHNLNPDAAIIVPGMAYQPPLIGFKQLLNFGAYSMPYTGGWIFAAAGAILLGLVIFEEKRRKKLAVPINITSLMVGGMLTLFFSGCSNQPQPIRIGQDNCDYCKMTISDKRFGGEIVTRKSKIYRFDDEHCIIAFLDSKKVAKQEIAGVYFADFCPPHQLINASNAHFLQSPALKSPMNGNVAAFSHEDSLIRALHVFYGNKITWEDIQK